MVEHAEAGISQISADNPKAAVPTDAEARATLEISAPMLDVT
jgi:hypothetical protein